MDSPRYRNALAVGVLTGMVLLMAHIPGVNSLSASAATQGMSTSQSPKSPWKSPWQNQNNVNLFTLVNNGFDVVGTFFSTGLGPVVEVVYLRKGKEFYRCITVEGSSLGSASVSEHECGKIVSPAENK